MANDADFKLAPVISEPGIKRDGTQFDGNNYVDGQWVRWNQRGVPQKTAGYNEISDAFSGVPRGTFVISKNGLNYVSVGSADVLEQIELDSSGYGGGISDRTPSGFVASDDNIWTFDSLFDAGGSGTALIAHAAPNLMDITSDVETEIYYGDAFGTADLTAAGYQTSGGIVASPPFLFAYGNDGLLAWSDENDPTTWSGGAAGDARITGSKLIKGLPVRGGSANAPATLIWSLDSLYRISYTGGTQLFSSDFVGGTSLLSTSAVVEFNGLYFWPTTAGQFVTYNGTLQIVKNTMNREWFFDNLNFQYRQKVWGLAVYQHNEIWWFYPRGNATECTHYVVYNVALNTFYDGELARSSGVSGYVFRWPLMTGNTPNASDKYQLWQHEFGVDMVQNGMALAIPSWFETGDVSFPGTGPAGQFIGKDCNIYIDRLEPDFVQTGDMKLTIKGRKFAAAETVTSIEYPFSPSTEYIGVDDQYREARFRFESNVQGGNYQLGQTLMRYAEGDGLP